MNPGEALRRLLAALPAVVLILFVAGCSTTPAKTDTGPKYNFFPPPPDAPRLQFLTAFDSDKDLRRGSSDGFVSFLTGKPTKVLPILKPYGGFAGRGKIYVCDTGDSVVLQMDLATRKTKVISPTGPAAFKLPLNMDVDDNGWLYIADGVRDQVVIVDSNENLVATIGEKGLMKPRDVVVSKDRVYVSDLQNHCVHVFDKAARTLLFDIPSASEAAKPEAKLFQPINIALDTAGRLYVSDFGAYRVQVFDADGKYLRTIGKYGDNFGEFARNKGVAVDRANRVYVASDGTPGTQPEFYQAVASAAGLPPPEHISAEQAPKRLSPMTLSFLEESRRFSNRRFVQELQVKLRYADFRQGVYDSLFANG